MVLISSRQTLGACLSLALLGLQAPGFADSTVVFNEIMYHAPVNEAQLEWIELHNQMGVDMDLSGWSLSDGVIYSFPEGTILEGGGYLVVAASPSALQAATGFAGAHGPFSGRLDNSGERLELRDNNFRLMDSLRYRDEDEWPVAPDGSGVSLAKIDPQTVSEAASSWAASQEVGGTPGAANFPTATGGGELPAGIVSFWRFDEAGSTVSDSADGNHGTFGTGTVRVAGLVGSGAFSFNNTSNAFINLGAGTGNNFSVSSGITLEALIRPTWSGNVAEPDEIFRKEDGANRILLSFQHDGTTAGRDVAIVPAQQPVLSFGLNIGGAYTELDMPLDGQAGRPTLAALKDGAAHHVAATYSSATGLKAIYIDGALAFSFSFPAGRSIASGGASTAYIGNMTGRAEPFTGVIDEVAFWSKALSPAEIAAHHAAARSGRDYFSTTGPVTTSALAFNEIATTGAAAWLEIINHGASTVALGGHEIVSAGVAGAGEHTLAPQNLAAGAYLVLTAAELGFDLLAGNKLFLYPPGGGGVVDAVELKDGLRGRHPQATGPWLYPDSPTPGGPNSFDLEDRIVLNEIMYHHRSLPALPPTTSDTVLFPLTGTWRYNDAGGDLGTSWRQPGFNDAAWPSGAALLYNETAALPAAKNTSLTLGAVTFYFRGRFDFAGIPEGAQLYLRLVVDDGTVVYLNGVEVLRWNMPDGAVAADTLASPGVGDATFSGPFVIPAASLRQGTNVLAAEVHQGAANSSDVVFGAELFASVVLSPGRPFQEPPESWVELHNRSAASVDLTDWRLDGGIAYAFAAGTVLPAGGYLVVSEDQDYLRELFPAARILGNFTGRLSNSSDRIVLKDARGNPADEVAYFDGGRWPAFADGGGPSLELRDARADNAQGEAWAASDEAASSEWTTYSYEQVAQANVGPTQWNEFLLGLLDAGEALVDDISVVEAPTGAAVELIANGDFESGATGWRLIGNHRHGEVIVDPDDPGGHVLHLVATGPTEHMHNHVETTLRSGRTVTNGQTYRISFRARWLVGSNQLNTRLYFNRTPRTTLLEVPELNGTPGSANSQRQTNIGPIFSELRHAPVVPAASEPVTVSVRVSDPDGIGTVRLWSSVNEGAWASALMSEGDPGVYSASLAGRAAATLVQFYVEASDGAGASATCPGAGRESRALYRVQDNQADLRNKHNLRLLMTPTDANFLHQATNVMSNDRMGATVIYDEREVVYDAGVRLKGSERGRNQPGRVGFNVNFPPEQLFRGIHETVSIDRSGGYGIGTNYSQDEILVKHMIQRAGGIPGMYDDIIRVIAPRSAQNGSALLQMARYGNVYLDSQFADGGEGSVFELELIYYPLTTSSGAPDGLKLPEPDNVLGVDIQDLGDDKEVYRWNFLLTNRQERDDYGSLLPFLKAMSLSAASLATRAPEVMDVDEWMRTFSMMSLCGIGDAYTRGNNHNLRLYVRPEDGKVLAMPWDWDFSFTQPSNASLWGDQNLQKVITHPPFLHLYYGHLLDLIETSFNAAYMGRWVTHYGAIAGQNYDVFLGRIEDRRRFVLSSLPARVTFAITTNNGQAFTVNTPTAVLEGNGWVDVRLLALASLPDPLELEWTGVTTWRTEVPLQPGNNALTLIALDADGTPLGSDAIQVTSTFNPPVPTISAVNPGAGAFEDPITIDGTGFLAGVQVFFGGIPAASLSLVDATRLVAGVPGLPAGSVNVTVRNSLGAASNPIAFTVVEPQPTFTRGDANRDGLVDISDALRILFHLFAGRPASCLDAADLNDSESLDLADVLFLLDYLFRQGASPPAPFPSRGQDPAGSPLDCDA